MPLDPRLSRAIQDHLVMAQSIAWRHIRRLPPGVDTDEILSVAMEALCQAAAKWLDYTARNGFNPWSEKDPDQPETHFGGYVVKTVNGRILDWARTQDYLLRAQRKTVKELQAAQEDGARTEEELAAATGLTAEQIRKARTAEGTKPCSLDDHLEGAGANYGGTLCDDRAGTESEVTVRETLAAAVAAFDGLRVIQQVLVALVFHQELDITVAARAVFLELADARRQLEAAVCEIHQAMLRAVSADGTGPRRPSPPLPPVHVRSADACHAAEAAARVKRCADCGELLPVEVFSWRDRARGYKVPYCPRCVSIRAGAAYVKRVRAARAVVRLTQRGTHFLG